MKTFIAVCTLSILFFLNLFVAQDFVFAESQAVCAINIDEDPALTGQRVANTLTIKMYNTDPDLLNTWNSLFGVNPETSPDDLLTLQSPDRRVTWEAGTLIMNGVMTVKVKTDHNDSTQKTVKIERPGKNDGTTGFVSGTGGVNPNVADGGWHEVKIKNLDNVTVTFDNDTITGFLNELVVKLDMDSSTADPVVKKFKLKIKGATSAPDVTKGYVSAVSIAVPETVVAAIAGTEYEETIKETPEILSGHTEAEFDRESGAATEGVDISSLLDGSNDQLKKRTGPCVLEGDDTPPIPKEVLILSLTFDLFVVSAVNFGVSTAWLSPPDLNELALDISIIGLNGGIHLHGEEVISLEDMTVVFGDATFTEVSAPWTTDTIPTVAGEVYRVCTTVVRMPGTTPEGPEVCRDFGPF